MKSFSEAVTQGHTASASAPRKSCRFSRNKLLGGRIRSTFWTGKKLRTPVIVSHLGMPFMTVLIDLIVHLIWATGSLVFLFPPRFRCCEPLGLDATCFPRAFYFQPVENQFIRRNKTGITNEVGVHTFSCAHSMKMKSTRKDRIQYRQSRDKVLVQDRF